MKSRFTTQPASLLASAARGATSPTLATKFILAAGLAAGLGMARTEAASLLWSATAPGAWDVGASQNWLNGVTPATFANGDSVTFGNAATDGNVDIPGQVLPASMTVNNSTLNYIFTGAGDVGGSGGLTKSGTGTLTLRNLTGWSYTGPTIIDDGVLLMDFNNANTPVNQILYAVSPGSLRVRGGTVRISSRANTAVYQSFQDTTFEGGASTVDQSARQSNGNLITYLGNILRSVGATVNFAPQAGNPVANTGVFTTLTNVNSILGGYVTFNGTSWATRNAVVQSAPGVDHGQTIAYAHVAAETAATAFNAATNNVDVNASNRAPTADRTVNSLRFNAASINLALTGANAVTSGGILVTPTANSAQITGGTLRGAAGTDLIVIQQNAASPFLIGSVVANNGGATALTKSGPGILILNGNNTYTGQTYINTGTLQVGNGGTSGDLSTSSGILNNGTLAFSRSDTVNYAGFIAGNGTVRLQGGGTFTFTGNTPYVGPTVISAGTTLQIGNGGTSGSIENSVSIANAGALVFNSSGSVNFAGPITGPGPLTKQGTGKLTLGGANIYAGDTTVNQGTLALSSSGSISNSTLIMLAAGATLDASAPGLTLNGAVRQTLSGSGTVLGNVTTTSGASIRPGASTVSGGLTGNLTFSNNLTVNGGVLYIDINPQTNDTLTVTGNLNLADGIVFLSFLSPPPNGTYKLIRYGTKSGSAANLILGGFVLPSQVAVLNEATPGEINLIVSSGTTSQLTWRGDGINNLWNVNSAANWLASGVASVFRNTDAVTFDDSGNNAVPVNLVGSIFPPSVAMTASKDYTFRGTGMIRGATPLTKSSSGKLTIINTNDSIGGIQVNAGTLQVGDGTTAGVLGFSLVNIPGANSGLIFNQPDNRNVPNEVMGSGSVTQQGIATLTLSGNNTSYNGPMTIANGILQIGAGGFSGSLGTGRVTNNTFLVFNRSGNVTQSGVITGFGSVTNMGDGTLTLAAANTYLGNTTIANGTVRPGVSNAIPSGPGSGNVALSGAGTFEISGFDVAIGGLEGTGGSVANSTGTGLNTVTLGSNTADTSFAGVIRDNAAGSGGRVALRKVGAGRSILTQANTYSGGTTLLEGILAFGNDASGGAGDVTMAGGTLAMNGRTINNNLIVNQPGSIENTGNSTLNNTQVTGTNTLLIFNGGLMTLNIANNLTGFGGTLLLSNATTIRFVGATGGDNTTFDLGQETASIIHRNGGNTVRLGALQGGAGTILRGANTVAGTTTYLIGGKNINSTFDGTIADGTFAGSPLALRKIGTGTLTLTGPLTYTGLTIVSNGVLSLRGDAALANTASINLATNAVLDVSQRTDATLTVATDGITGVGQILTGAGIVRGTVVIAAGATLSPGVPAAGGIGRLTITNALTLQEGCAVLMDVDSVARSNDSIGGLARITYAGALTVSSTNPIASAVTFKLFDARTYSGAFSSTNLPPLADAALSWDLSQLGVSGTIKVNGPGGVTPPTLSGVQISGNNIVLSGTGGAPGKGFSVMTSTSINLPLAQWTSAATGTFDASGNFSVSIAIVPNQPLQFFVVQALP